MIGLILFLSSCTYSSEKKSSFPDSISSKRIKVKKFFSGSPDIPRDSFTITSAGIGPILLGDSLEKLGTVFQKSNYKISELMMSEDGKQWPAMKLSNDKTYIIAESANTVNLISVLRTNDPRYSTVNGIHVGMTLDSLNYLNDSIYSDLPHKTLMYGKSGVWFKVDDKTERNYFLKGLHLESFRGGKIEELIIYCGDC